MNKNNVIVNIKHLKIKNFLSIKDVSLDFSSLNGLVFVQGINYDTKSTLDKELTSNGAGKSSVFSALLFGLYGETLHEVKIQSICNKQFLDQPSSVIIDLIGQDGHEYKILTAIENQSMCRIKIFRDGNIDPINSSSIKDTRKFIETTITGIPLEVFKRRVLLVNDGSQDFFNLRSDKKLQLIENSFGLGIFGHMYKVVHQDFLKIQKDISLMDQRIKQYEKIVKELQESHNSFDKKKIEKSQIFQNELSEILNLLLSEVQLTKLDFTKITNKIQSIKNSIVLSKEKIKQLTEQKQKLHSLEFKIKHMFKTNLSNKERYEKALEIICDDCKSKVTNTLINEDFNPSFSNETLTKIRSNILITTTTLKNLESSVFENEKIQKNIVSLMQKLEMGKHKLKEVQAQISPFDELIKKNSAEMEEAVKLQTSNYEKYNYLNFADYAMSENGVKQFIIRDIIAELNSRIQYYLIKLGATYTVKFDEKFNTKFFLDNSEMELNNFSSGEKVKLKLATLFVFRDLLFSQISTSFNILVIDEFFDSSIDNFTIQQILKILEEIALKQHCTIFIISHRDIIKENIDKFSGKIILEKRNGISSLIIEELK